MSSTDLTHKTLEFKFNTQSKNIFVLQNVAGLGNSEKEHQNQSNYSLPKAKSRVRRSDRKRLKRRILFYCLGGELTILYLCSYVNYLCSRNVNASYQM